MALSIVQARQIHVRAVVPTIVGVIHIVAVAAVRAEVVTEVAVTAAAETIREVATVEDKDVKGTECVQYL